MKTYRHLSALLKQNTNLLIAIAAALTMVSIGLMIISSGASGFFASNEPEDGTVTGNAQKVTIGNASGGKAIQFNAPVAPPPPPPGGGGGGGGGSTVPSPLKIMPLGDSLTQGGVNAGLSGLDPTTVNGYRLELKNLLVAAGYTIDYVGSIQVGNAQLSDKDENGFSGACIKISPCGGGTLYPQTAGWLTTYTPDLVIMQGGENDFSNGSLTEAQNAANMQSWIQLVWTTLPNAKIIVTGVPWHTDYAGSYGDLVHTYVDGLKAQGKPIRWVPYGEDIGRIDGTHPNAAGYLTWANELAPMVQQLYPL